MAGRWPRHVAGKWMGGALLALWAGSALAAGIPAPDPQTLAAQWETYMGDTVPSVVEFAPMRATQEVDAAEGARLRLISLHPGVNRWYLLERIPAEGQGRTTSFHFENADAETWYISLAAGDDPALRIEGADGEVQECRPWSGAPSELDTAANSGLPYAPVCGGRLYLRNKVAGSRSNREAVSDFLRKNVIFGDKLVNLIKGTFFEDAFLESASTSDDGDNGDVVAALGKANLDRRPLMRTVIGLPVEGAEAGMEAGSWYALDGVEGVFASVMQPGMVAEEITSQRNGANWLDGVERNADVYLVAFDLNRFELGYELGTDHPSLGWSSRPQRSGADWNLPGPDGFNRPDPLVLNGMLSPSLTSRVVAAFAGGFKRDHGAWRFGDYATFNRGHHYGFLMNGVTFSRLHENLATLYVDSDGSVGMKSWEQADNAMIPRLRYARQNGVPVVRRDPETGMTVPGDRVTSWGGGNWSGSAEAVLRTLRAGACLRESGGRKFLIYAYFSSATPSAMARTFQAYDCDYGMLLDMNAPELTYLAVYRQNASGDGLEPSHLVRGMAAADPWGNDGRIPRFVGFSDNRDFFYLLRKE